ncbi:hypothetical protein AB0J52_04505 [Spirillospora sp. NPDC049652]
MELTDSAALEVSEVPPSAEPVTPIAGLPAAIREALAAVRSVGFNGMRRVSASGVAVVPAEGFPAGGVLAVPGLGVGP